MSTKGCVSGLCWLLGAAVVLTSVASQGAPELGGHLERPDAQSHADLSTSWIERSFTWPNGTGNELAFWYRTDSEAGWDFLVATLDGAELGRWSGSGNVGLAKFSVSPGTHTLRFSYVKDSSLSRGMDTAYVDDVRILRADGSHSDYSFGADASGWTSGGFGGGWGWRKLRAQRSIRRPIGQAFAGYTSSSSSSYIERSIVWPAGTRNRLGFTYFVDSEAGWDFFRVLVDGAVVFSESGFKQGYRELPVTGGAHVVRFEYAKDTSVDAGRDVAYVETVFALGSSGAFEKHDFSGLEVGAVPFGWASGGSAGGWLVDEVEPPRAYVSDASFTPPAIDGVVNAEGSIEYNRPTMVELVAPLAEMPSGGNRMLLRADAQLGTLYVGARLPRTDDAGTASLYLDANRAASVAGYRCSSNGYGPTQEDRRIDVNYNSLNVIGVVQYLGGCTSWVPIAAGGGDEWPVAASVSAPAADAGHIHLELAITTRPRASQYNEPFATDLLGLHLHLSNGSGGSQFLYPFDQPGDTAPFDVSRWQTLDFGTVPMLLTLPRVVVIDAIPENE